MLPSLPPPSDALKHADATLRPLMQSLRDRLTDRTPDLASIKGSLVALLEYLSSAIGCTDSNCRAVASFFWLDDEWPMELLPEDFQRCLLIWMRSMIRSPHRKSRKTLIPLLSSFCSGHVSSTPNQSMKPTAPFQSDFCMFATTPCRGLSLLR